MKNRNFLALILVPMMSGLIGCASLKTAVHPNWMKQRSPRIAVLPFKGDAAFSDKLADTLVTELINEGHAVIERTQMDRIINEYKLQYSGVIDPETLAQTGRITGVDIIVLGTLSTRPVVPALEWFLGDGIERDQVDFVHVRWINVQNGQIMASTRFRNSRGGNVEGIARKIIQSLTEAVRTTETRTREQVAKMTSDGAVAYAYSPAR